MTFKQLLCVALALEIGIAVRTAPVVGVVMLNTEGGYPSGSTYVLRNVLKWIEQFNIRWIPLYINDSRAAITDKLSKINGILLTGGEEPMFIPPNDSPISNAQLRDNNYGKLSRYMKFISSLVQIVNKLNDYGIKLSIWGTCLGFESLLLALSDLTTPINNDLDNLDILLPAKFDLGKQSIMNLVFNNDQLAYMSTNNVFHYGHRWGFLIEKMNSDTYVQENIDIVATATTVHNQEVIAIFQHKKYPYFGIQFHPELAQFSHEEGVKIDKSDNGLFYNRQFGLAFLHLLDNSPMTALNGEVIGFKRDMHMTLTMFNANEAFYTLPFN